MEESNLIQPKSVKEFTRLVMGRSYFDWKFGHLYPDAKKEDPTTSEDGNIAPTSPRPLPNQRILLFVWVRTEQCGKLMGSYGKRMRNLRQEYNLGHMVLQNQHKEETRPHFQFEGYRYLKIKADDSTDIGNAVGAAMDSLATKVEVHDGDGDCFELIIYNWELVKFVRNEKLDGDIRVRRHENKREDIVIRSSSLDGLRELSTDLISRRMV